MKWVELNGKKEPPFNKKMLIIAGAIWQEVILKEIKTTDTGKEYTFCNQSDTEQVYTNATHYMVPEPPKNNQ